MAYGSLRLRLIGAAALGLALALALSGLALSRIFTRHVEARVDAELFTHLNQITAAIEVASEGGLQIAVAPADPRFDQPGSGLYWQVDPQGGGMRLRSRSLWDSELGLPQDELQDGSVHHHKITATGGTELIVLERALTLGPDARPISARIAVALDRREIAEAERGFRSVLVRSLVVLGLALLAALWMQVQVGLRPLAALRAALNRVRDGAGSRVEGGFPTEVQPLVQDMNALLARERRNIERARERAGDLAHGFKTPLAVLAAISRDLEREGRTEAAREITTQIDMMSRHVERELARARTVGSASVGRAAVPVLPVVKRVTGALQRIAADRDLKWRVEVDEAAVFPGDENDLLEIVGNLAENAAKWATTQVVIRGRRDGERMRLVVADDGPGLPSGSEADALRRGHRLDERPDSSGLGLSIVAKLVETYAGTLELGRAAIGGLEVEIAIPLGAAQSSSK